MPAAPERAPADLADLPEISATEAKNSFGRVFEAALAHGAVAITKRNQPKAVLLSIDTYNALVERQNAPLHTLAHEFDQLLGSLQSPAARDALDLAFNTHPDELGRIAVAAARA